MLIALLSIWLLAQVPCNPSESSVVCHCKQGVASACEALKEINPQKFAEIQRMAKAKEAVTPQATEQVRAATGEAIKAVGQEHHVISKRIFEKLKTHRTLQGQYKARDPRFVTRAKDLESHNG